jgi:hypothetical protein
VGEGAPLSTLGRTFVRLKAEASGRGNDVGVRAEAMTRRPAGWQGSWRPAVAEPQRPGRRMGRRPTRGGWGGGSRPRSGGRRRRTDGVVGGKGVGGSVDDGFREAGSGGESPGGAEDVGTVEGGGQGG